MPRRIGLPIWPLLRRLEAELVAKVRERLGAGQFDQAFSAGSALTQREAVAVIRDQARGAPPGPRRRHIEAVLTATMTH